MKALEQIANNAGVPRSAVLAALIPSESLRLQVVTALKYAVCERMRNTVGLPEQVQDVLQQILSPPEFAGLPHLKTAYDIVLQDMSAQIEKKAGRDSQKTENLQKFLKGTLRTRCSKPV